MTCMAFAESGRSCTALKGPPDLVPPDPPTGAIPGGWTLPPCKMACGSEGSQTTPRYVQPLARSRKNPRYRPLSPYSLLQPFSSIPLEGAPSVLGTSYNRRLPVILDLAAPSSPPYHPSRICAVVKCVAHIDPILKTTDLNRCSILRTWPTPPTSVPLFQLYFLQTTSTAPSPLSQVFPSNPLPRASDLLTRLHGINTASPPWRPYQSPVRPTYGLARGWTSGLRRRNSVTTYPSPS